MNSVNSPDEEEEEEFICVCFKMMMMMMLVDRKNVFKTIFCVTLLSLCFDGGGSGGRHHHYHWSHSGFSPE